MLWNGLSYLVSRKNPRKQKQWSRSFAPAHVKNNDDNDLCDGLSPIHTDEAFFDSPSSNQNSQDGSNRPMYSSTSASVRNNGWQIKSNQHELEMHSGMRVGNRISSQLLDGIMDNSRRPLMNEIKLQRPNDLDDRHDYRPFFTCTYCYFRIFKKQRVADNSLLTFFQTGLTPCTSPFWPSLWCAMESSRSALGSSTRQVR